VAQVLAALQPRPERPSHFARWKEFFRLVPSAHAQAENLAGITVSARQGNTTFDTATTDAAGSFTLQVAAGTVTLEFMTATFTVSTDIAIPANTTVIIVVILQPTEVVLPTHVVVEEDLTPIRCTGGRVQLLEEVSKDVVIDGHGEDCIRAEGQCTIDLAFRSLALINCERCIRAEGTADVFLTTGGDLHCEHGIRAEGTAAVVLDILDCVIDSGEEPVRIEGAATVDGCGL
jgi:hypothetical protein